MNDYQYGTQGQQMQRPPQQQQAQQQSAPAVSLAEQQRRVRAANAGKRYCRNCGEEIQAGASVCIHCKAVLNPVAIRRAQEIVMDRQAKVDKATLRKCFFFPKHGMELYKKYLERRPQVAEPCKKAATAGKIFRGVLMAATVVAALVFLRFGSFLF